ncbi:hypothetical protein [Gaoshiqia sp. Z1-71]|uniref:hypothetical protein n=1 Tax=Gaoshiqia hydrogeniformans TaxID=3290090 RepID=UPI003BF87820
MMKRVKRFGVFQTSKVAAIILFAIAFVFMLPISLISGLAGNNAFPGFPFGGGFFFILFPVLYGIMGFIMTAIGCAIYNLIVQWTGGIEIEVELVDESQEN